MQKLILFGCVLSIISGATAQSKMGPSARAAARLEKNPPPTWIKHYLPDDRYKIAGKVWKYVSTEVDRSYHTPNSNFMLTQSPNRVIGFASAKEAEDAGYRAGPSVPLVTIKMMQAERRQMLAAMRSAALRKSQEGQNSMAGQNSIGGNIAARQRRRGS